MNQISAIGFGTDASVLLGYAETANERLGNIDFIIENTGNIPLYFRLRAYDGVTSPSGYANIGSDVTVAARGTKTLSYTLLNKRVGIFGSGVAGNVSINGVSTFHSSTTANVTAVIRNKGDIRGAQIDITVTGRKSWTYDPAFNKPDLTKKWGTVNSTTGDVDTTKEGV